MSINDFDNDFATYVSDEETQKKLGQVFTPYSIIEQMMDKAGSVQDKNSVWYDETKTNLDPTMGAGNIVIAMLYRRIVQCDQNPLVALSNVYGVELDSKTLTYARERIYKFMMAVEKKSGAKWSEDDWKKIHDIIYCKNPFTNSEYPNFVCSDIFAWNINLWKPEKECLNEFEGFLE